MNGYDYRDKHYPKPDFEDKKFLGDELYDAIAYAYDAGKQEAKINSEIAKTLMEYLNNAWEFLVKSAKEDSRYFVNYTLAKHCIDDARDLLDNLMNE